MPKKIRDASGDKIRFLLVGCGSIGRRHLDNLVKMRRGAVGVCDNDPDTLAWAREQYGLPVFTSLDDGLAAGPEAVILCTHANAHVPMALKALKTGAHLFIEKPLSNSMRGVDALKRAAASSRSIIQIGYNLRFHPGIRKMKEVFDSGVLGEPLSMHTEFGLYLAYWWPGKDYRKSYMRRKSSGGGLVSDCSHDIDLIRWFMGNLKSVTCVAAKTSLLETDIEDVANILLTTKRGKMATIRLDCLQPEYTRTFKLIGSKGSIFWVCTRGRRMDTTNGKLWISLKGSRFKAVPITGRVGGMYRDEMRSFVDALDRKRAPVVTLDDGWRALRAEIAAMKSSKAGRRIPLS